jgi:RND family efflux transporter MFP subunit
MMSEPTNSQRDLSVLRIDRGDAARRGGRRWLPIALALGAVALLALGWVNRGAILPASKVKVATVRSVTAGGAGGALTASGYVVAQRQSTLSPRSTGRLDWLGADEGDRVRAGQIVARLQHESQEAALGEARARAAQARADLEEARSSLQLARADEGRQRQLRTQGVNTARDLDAAVAEREQAEARVNSLTAAIAVADAALKSAEVDLEQTVVRAPFDGVITARRAEVGEMLSAGAFAGQPTGGAVFVLADFDSLEVEADVAEANLAKAHVGAPARIVLDAYPDAPFRATVRQIVPTADRQRAIVQVKLHFLEPDERILPEMSAQVSFLDQPDAPGPTPPPTLTIPAGAIVRKGERTSAWVVKDGVLARRAIVVGAANGGTVAVIEGLKAGETVVVDPADGLAEGGRVVPEEG